MQEVAPKVAKVVPAAKKQTTVTNLKKKDESSDSSENDSDTDEDDVKSKFVILYFIEMWNHIMLSFWIFWK